MTALTAGIGLIPLVLAAGQPEKRFYTRCHVILGGVISSTLLDFFVHPALSNLRDPIGPTSSREPNRRTDYVGEEAFVGVAGWLRRGLIRTPTCGSNLNARSFSCAIHCPLRSIHSNFLWCSHLILYGHNFWLGQLARGPQSDEQYEVWFHQVWSETGSAAQRSQAAS